MLTPPTRPRAPSAATLRVLYQLAYISSGTAVGIGALCAEERRRRTQIVQKVADNAKRIRQSPRYAHGSAAAAVREQEFEDDWTWQSDVPAQRELQHLEEYKRTGIGRRFENSEGGKMPELPSVVEEEYGRLADRSEKRRRKRTRGGRADFVEEHGQRDHVARIEPDGPRMRQGTPLPRNHSPQALQQTRFGLNSAKKASWELVEYRRVSRPDTPEDYILERQSPRTELFHASLKGRRYQSTEKSWERVVVPFATRSLWEGHNSTDKRKLSPDILAEDVNIFFDKVHADQPSPMNIEHACKIADNLLQLSLNLSSIQEIRSLLLWKIAADALKFEDLHNVVGVFAALATHMGPEPTLQFYSDLFATTAFRLERSWERFRLELQLRAEALKMSSSDEFEGAYRDLTDTISIPEKVKPERAADLLAQQCRELLSDGHLSAAIDLWCITTRARTSYLPADAPLDNELYNSAIKAKHVSLCLRMLRLKSSCGFNGVRHNIHQQKDAFIKLCFDEGSTGLLRSVFGHKANGALDRKHLSQHSYVCLGLCFAEENRGFESFNVYYKRFPPALRASVAEASVNVRAASMRADWKATRDLDHIRSNYQAALERYARGGMNEQALRPLHVAMTEIQLSANQPIQAMTTLSGMKESKMDSNVAVLTALALAKQNDWSSFERLIGVLHRDPLEWTSENKRAFNNALHLFSRQHTAQQMSDLVDTAITKLDFQPNQATWEILLSCFVSKKAMSLLRQWLCGPSNTEARIEMHTNIGAALMKTWYLDFRHSHVMVMWYCRALVQKAPSLNGGQLWNVIREALGFDLRTLRGTNAPLMEPILRTRADLLSKTEADVPKPGYIWNWELYSKDEDQVQGLDQKIPNEARAGDAQQEYADVPSPEDLNVDNVAPPWSFAWQELRPSYADNSPKERSADTGADWVDVSTLERQMILQLSLGQHQAALQLYQDSLDAAGLPASPIVLEVALEASLRLYKHAEDAQRIITAAADAGMNVACAMGPLLIDQMRQLSNVDKHTATSLRIKTIEYYRMNERNGLHVKHQIGTHAAYVLIHNGFAELGVNLLSTIFRSDWSAVQPMDITAMSVWFLGYADLGDLKGMSWVVGQVLEQNTSVDMGFIRTLRRARRPARRNASGAVHYKRQDRKTMAYLRYWSHAFHRRRSEQMQASKVFGRKMINVIARAANRDTTKTAEQKDSVI
ncbi:hypothetical protein Q7P37_008164 [Cladosporium fusiforme]